MSTYDGQYHYFNLPKMSTVVDSMWGFPFISSSDFEVFRLHQFGDNKGYTGTAHFFLNDYMFERVWNNPDKYLNMLRKYDGVLGPDFSLFTDYPRAVQVYNTFRNRWLTKYWQENGIQVIPTISWADEDSFDFCFKAVEEGSTVAISTVGSLRSQETVKLFLAGYREMIRVIKPSKVLIYGKEVEGLEGNIQYFEPFYNRYDGMEYNSWKEDEEEEDES